MKISLVKNLLFTLPLLLSIYTLGQQDSIRFYPKLRPLILQIEEVGTSNYTSRLMDEAFEKGEISRDLRINAFLTLPILLKDRWFLTASINYLHESIIIKDVKSSTEKFSRPESQDQFNINDVSTNVNFIYLDTLWGRSIVYNGGLIIDSDNVISIDRLRGFASAFMSIMKTKYLSMRVGLVGLIDPISTLPILPVFSYRQTFRNSTWRINMTLPSNVSFRRPVLDKGWFTVGALLSGTSFFQSHNSELISGDFEYSTTEIKSAFTFEYPIQKHFMLGVQTGIRSTIMARMREKGNNANDFTGDANRGSTPFINMSLSFAPVYKNKRR